MGHSISAASAVKEDTAGRDGTIRRPLSPEQISKTVVFGAESAIISVALFTLQIETGPLRQSVFGGEGRYDAERRRYPAAL